MIVCHAMCVVPRVSSNFDSNDISSLTTGWILTKLGRNDPYMDLFDHCLNSLVCCILYLGHIG